MSLNKNTKLIGQHAYLSPSSYHWLNYDEEKLRRVYNDRMQTSRGTALHAYAQQAIDLQIRQSDNGTTMSRYVNDAIGFRMSAEIGLFYSIDCFGTADAIGIRMEQGRWVLRISDLKTGITPAGMTQLLIYCGIFFFEYNELYDPRETDVILRIYQNDDVVEYIPDLPEILSVMSKIKEAARIVAYLREED
jgi:hypothetical protein